MGASHGGRNGDGSQKATILVCGKRGSVVVGFVRLRDGPGGSGCITVERVRNGGVRVVCSDFVGGEVEMRG